MKRKFWGVLLAVFCATTIFLTGVYAGGNLQNITAYLNYGVSVAKDGQVQALKDAQGHIVTPITYNDSTYLPVRAISQLLGHSVGWDGATQCVLLDGSAVPASLTSYNVSDNIEIPWVIADTYDISFINNIISSSKTKLVYSDYSIENYIANGLWQGKAYSLSSGETAYSFYNLEVYNPNSKYKENQAMIEFEKAIYNALDSCGFTLMKDENNGKHYVRGNMEFIIYNYNNSQISINLKTKWLTCCAEQR